jgi:hypothetical protein
MVLWAGFKKKLRLYVELQIYDKNRQKITGPLCVIYAIHGAYINWSSRPDF